MRTLLLLLTASCAYGAGGLVGVPISAVGGGSSTVTTNYDSLTVTNTTFLGNSDSGEAIIQLRPDVTKLIIIGDTGGAVGIFNTSGGNQNASQGSLSVNSLYAANINGNGSSLTGVLHPGDTMNFDSGLITSDGAGSINMDSYLTWQSTKAQLGLAGPDNAEFGVNIAADAGSQPDSSRNGVMLYLDTRPSFSSQLIAVYAQSGAGFALPLKLGLDGKLVITGSLKSAGILTAEGQTFYAHTVAGSLVWTTSP